MEHELTMPPGPAPSRETAYELLSRQRRRFVVHALTRHDPPLDVSELAAAVVDREVAEPSTEACLAVAVTLHHVHLPKLDAAEVVDYDPETRTVTAARPEAIPSLRPGSER